MKLYGIRIGIVLLTIFAFSNISYAAQPYTVEKDYTAQDPEQSIEFEEEIKVNGKRYRLWNVDKEVIDDNAKENSITVTSPPYINDDSDYMQEPEKEYQTDGKDYVLYSFKTIDIMVEDRTKEVSSDIRYPNVEQADRIPDTGLIEVTDEITGTKKEVILPLKMFEYSEYRWIDGFEFEIIVQDFDADYYMLGNELVPKKEEQPFQGYEEQLLNLIHVDPAYYKIDTVSWISEPYQADGIWYRSALARGQKQVADLTATYGGLVILDAAPGYAVEAIYYPKLIEYQMKATATYQKHPLSFFEWLWELINDHPVYAAIALIAFVWLIVLIIYLLSKKKKEKTKEGGAYDNEMDEEEP